GGDRAGAGHRRVPGRARRRSHPRCARARGGHGVSTLLVVAGEASGDRAAEQVVARLAGVHTFGMGGGALEREGTELVADLRKATALGVAEVARRACGVALAYARVRRAAARRRPRAALLVNYTEFNTRLAAELSRAGTRVLWYGAPQI